MPRIDYSRCDLPVTVTGTEQEDEILIRVGRGRVVTQARIAAGFVRDHRLPDSIVADLFRALPPEAFRSDQLSPAAVHLDRIALEVAAPLLAALDWEAVLGPAASLIDFPSTGILGRWAIVRTSRVRPRVLDLPFTLPLRILQVNALPDHELDGWVRSLFGTHDSRLVERALLAHSTSEWAAPDDWPTIDIVHIDALPDACSAEELLTLAHPERPGTLGWLTRVADRWQTRLVAVHCRSDEECARARALAQALCNKGGPAVVVVGPPSPPYIADVDRFFRSFYELLIHDRPLDLAYISSVGLDSVASSFVGGGREEGVRVSSPGALLLDWRQSRIWSRIQSTDTKPPSADLELRTVFVRDPSGIGERLETELAATEVLWQGLRFEDHEGGGFLPLAAELDRLRSQVLGGGRMARVTSANHLRPAVPEERFVNATLWSETDGKLVAIEAAALPPEVGALHHLGVQIGKRDVQSAVIDAVAIFEEVFKWSPEVEGVWIEIGVTGIDFDVIGDPVQDLWLPRTGETDTIYFAVSPKVARVAQLRFALYYRNNLIKSFRLAALTRSADTEAPEDGAAAIAAALGVPRERIADRRHAVRLEYSRTAGLAEIERKPPRGLSISANEHEGKSILTIKGTDVFEAPVHPDSEMKGIVKEIRGTLNEVAWMHVPDVSEPLYRFGEQGDPKVFDRTFEESLLKLASVGTRLYLNLAPNEKSHRRLVTALSGGRKTIQVAPLLREKVIPWALVYDREFDDQVKTIDGQPASHLVCRALLASPRDGARDCGEHRQCLLHPQRRAELAQEGTVYNERTVACPLHFWGFRHVIEAPPQQVEGEDDDTGQAEKVTIVPTGPLQLAAGLNQTVAIWDTHWKALCKIRPWEKPEYDRDRILELLKNDKLDLIYFFCHAYGGEADEKGTDPPYLEFQTIGGSPGIIRPQDLPRKPAWSHGPLVFLNACGTLGYSPDALSPFLRALVDRKGAAGVLGTEVPVAPILADEVAQLFIERFVRGEAAGEALLEVRLTLLARKIPLALVYTLHAPAELAIAVPALAPVP